MGDSYAAGIGAGRLIHFDQGCFRYDEAYPVVLDGELQPHPSRFNFVACSGDKFPTILEKQFRDAPSTRTRPNWGDKPEFVTLSMGGNDIGFKELVSTCIYSIPITLRDCDQIIADSMKRVHSPEFVRDASGVIITALLKGTARVGQDFKVYVTGYAQFFNEQTTQCNHVSFRPPWSQFLPKQYLTIERRQRLNLIARELNLALKTAVMTASVGAPNRVFFVDYDAQFNGHRFCDRHEPNPEDPNTWFLTYGSDEAAIGDFLNSIPRIHSLLSGQSNNTLSESEFYQLISEAAEGDPTKVILGAGAVQIFHPKPVGHQVIAEQLRLAILATRALSSTGAHRGTA
jgi:hypothetical protein